MLNSGEMANVSVELLERFCVKFRNFLTLGLQSMKNERQCVGYLERTPCYANHT
jgi:hypothetical protein